MRLLEDDKSALLVEEEFRPIIGCSFAVCTVEESRRWKRATELRPFVVTVSIRQSRDAVAGFVENGASSSDAGDQSDK